MIEAVEPPIVDSRILLQIIWIFWFIGKLFHTSSSNQVWELLHDGVGVDESAGIEARRRAHVASSSKTLGNFNAAGKRVWYGW